MKTPPTILSLVTLCFLSGVTARASAELPGKERISGGENATVGQFPWQVSITMDRTHFCSGALVAPDWVLTSAQCTKGYSAFILSMGSLYPDSHFVEESLSHEKYVHPAYVAGAEGDPNDIGLIKLKRNITFTEIVSMVTIEGSTESFAGHQARIAGWGDPTTRLLDHLSPTLHWTETTVVADQECLDAQGNPIGDTHLCTYDANAVGICEGDNGGGLVLDMYGNWRLVGVATYSLTTGCYTGTPSVYTRISMHADWITSVTGIVITPTMPTTTTTEAPGSASTVTGRLWMLGVIFGMWFWGTHRNFGM